MKQRITPNCCEDCIKHQTIALGYSYYTFTSGHTFYDNENNTPVWVVAIAEGRMSYFFVPVKFCPHCRAELPKIKKRENVTEKICVPGDDYCNTCKERLQCCECLPSEFAWEVDRG